MTKTILKKALTLLMALCLLAGLLPVRVRAAGVQVSTLPELQSALKTAKQSITLNSTITIASDTELDLNGCTVECAQDTVTIGLDVTGGILTIRDSAGAGSISGTGSSKNFAAIRVMGGSLVLEGGAIKATAAAGSTVTASAILVPSDYAYSSDCPNAVYIRGGTVDAVSDANTKAILMNSSENVGITITDGTVKAHSRTGDYAYAVYLNANPFLISGGAISSESKSSSKVTYPYAIYRAASGNPLNDAEVRGADTKIDGIVYVHGGVNKVVSGFTGGKYSAQLNYAYVHSGCKLNMHEDETDAPYYWWVSGGTTGNYTINFDGNGGTGSMSSITAEEGEDRILPACAFSREGYSFLGWAMSSGGEVMYNDRATVRNLARAGDAATLYAVWHRETFTVTWYDFSGNGVLETDEAGKNEQPVFRGTEPVLLGAVFRGWATEPEQTKGVPVSELPPVTKNTAYYAAFSQFAPERCTLNWYDYTGKTRLDRSDVAYGSHPVYNGEQPVCNPTGYQQVEFRGWNTAPRQSTGSEVADLPLVTDDTSYYAAFSMAPISYSVAFKANGGEGSMAEQSFVYDEAQALTPNAFTKTGYHFIGWAETADGPVKYTDQQKVKNLASEQGATVMLYALWEIDLHTVTWYDQFGEGVLYQDTMAEYGSKPVFRGMLPVVLGGNFTGWATEPRQESGAQEKDLPAVTDDVNYYASYKGWTPDYHTVTWMDYDGKTVLAVKSYAENSAAVYPGETDPTRTRTGYTCAFRGWATSKEQSKGEELPRVTEDATYYAAFIDSPNRYRVRYMSEGGYSSSTDQVFIYDEPQALRPNYFPKTGWHFIYWTRWTPDGEVRHQDREVVMNLTDQPDGLVYLNAAWEINKYTVTWCHGTEVLASDTVQHGDKPVFSGTLPTLLGGEFKGWATEPGQKEGTAEADLPVVTENTVYYAAYSGWTPAYYTITWKDYTGKNVLAVDTLVENAEVSYKGETPARSRTGYACEFKGWALTPGQSEGVELPRAAADAVYYASFLDTPNSYTVQYDPNGGEGSMAEQSFVYDEAQALTPNAFTKTGHHFLGWALTPDGEAAYEDEATAKNLADSGTVTLYAVWEINTYTVTWCDNAGVLERDEAEHGAKPVYNGATPSVAGGSFAGWATEPGKTQGTAAENLPAVTEDTVYYAAFSGWTPAYYTVTWMDYEGKNVLAVDTLVHNAAVSYKGETPARSRTGYACAFQGWALTPKQSEGIELPRAAADTVYYAAFLDTPNSYTVQFDPNGGEGSMADQSFTYDEAQALSANAFTKTGHHFLGWALMPEGGVAYQDKATAKNLVDAGSVTLYAVWEINTYTVTWCDSAGVLERDEVQHGAKPVYNGATPFVAGGSFAGWATEPGQTAGMEEEDLPPVTEDTVYYAAFSGWTPSYYTITWKSYDGKSVLAIDTLVRNAAVSFKGETPIRSRTGYACEFKGWALTPGQSEGVELPRAAADAVYYASFLDTPNSYTVQYDPNGGDGSMTDQSFVYDAAQALNANAFTKEHYHFLGWALTPDGAVKYEDKATVRNLADSGSVTLYAVWEINTYTVTWCSGDYVLEADTVVYNVQPLYSGDEDAIPTPLVGAAFAGWATKPGQSHGTPDKPTNLLPPVTEDTVYYAAFAGWAPEYYTVTWKSYDGKDVLAVKSYANNAHAVYPEAEDPTRSRTGYVCAFQGWALTPKQSEGISLPNVTADAVYYAAFLDTPNSYTVQFDPNGGDGSMTDQSFVYDKAQALSANAFTKTGRHFLGWALTQDGAVKYQDKARAKNLAASGSVTLYAVWEINTYTVTWCDSAGVLERDEVQHGAKPKYNGATPSVAGGTFNGWATEPGQTTGTEEENLPVVTEDTVYYAAFSGWTPAYYTITWMDYAGKNVLAVDTLVQNAAVSYKGETPTRSRTGYASTFQGWALTPKQSEGISLPNVTEDAVYYAAFLDTPNSYTVQFDPNGGDGSMAEQSFVYDAAQALSANAFTNTGRHFLGWALTQDGAVKYADKASVKNLAVSGSVTLYAVWEINTYTVTWCDSAGVLERDEVQHGAKPVYNGATPFVAGGSFAGWATEPGQTAGTEEENLPAVTEDTVYYAAFAGWAPEYYTVTWKSYDGKTVLAVKSYANNSHAVYPEAEDPTRSRTGYACAFQGWALTPKQSEGISLPNVTEDAVYYAAFLDTPNSYTVQFDPNGGDGSMTDQSFVYDEAQALTPNAFTKTGRHFLGWALTPDGAVKYQDKARAKNLAASGSVTLYAVWEINTYTVTWCDSAGVLERDEVQHGEKPKFSGATPTVAGGSFAGWATEPGQTTGTEEENLPVVTEDTVYYAAFSGWTPSYYTIRWMDETGGTVLRIDTLVQNAAVSYKGETPTRSRTGYACVFQGWALTPGQSEGIEIPRAAADAVYYAAFLDTPNSYTVKYDPNGGTGSMADQNFVYDEAQALSANAFAAAEGFHFLGWALTPDGAAVYADKASVKNLAETGSVTLYAIWEINTYTVTWCFMDEVLERDVDVPHGSAPEFNGAEPFVTGGRFTGWATEPGQTEGKPVSELPKVTKDVVYHGAFSGWAPDYYTITWMDYRGSSILYSARLVTNAEAVYRGEQPTKRITGYDSAFKGWAYLPDQSEPIEVPRVSENAVYYAAFDDVPHSYTIAFDPNGGTGSMASVGATYDAFVTLPAVGFTARAHEQFVGWAMTPDGDVRFADCATVVNLSDEQGATVTLYAVWAARRSVAVTFDANGGSCTTAEKAVYVGEPYGELPTATRSDYNFTGWFTEAAGGAAVLADTTVERTEAHTLYAHWSEGGGGGGGGGDEPGKLTTSMNPDGSLTETKLDRSTDEDGTVTTISTETTTWPDGRKQEIRLVETERVAANGNGGTTTVSTKDDSTVNTLSDGSVNSYRNVHGTETTTGTSTAGDGTVTETIAVQTKDKLTQTVTDAHGAVSGTETETISREETKTVTRRSADGSAVVTEEWSVDTRTTETEVGGAAQATVTERLAERSVSKTVSASGAVSGSGSYSKRGSSSGPAGESSFTAEGTVTLYTDEKGSVLTVREGTRSTTAADGSARTVHERLTDGVSALGTTAGMEEIDGVLRSASAYLSDAAVEAARSKGIPAVIPLTVEPADSPESAVPIEVDLRVIGSRRLDGHLNVSDMPLAEIGVTERGVGIIAFYLAGDGTPAPIRECREGSVIFPVNDYMQVVIAHNDKSFPDVSMTDWFGSSALFTAAREVLIGTGELFEPDIWMSRAMVAQLIYNYERDRRAAPDDFDDVNPGDWFADAVGWAGSVGYVKGDGVSFRPYDPITRQDLVTILYRYALDEGYNVSARADLGRFPDAADVADYAREALRWAVADGVILGMDDGTISPTTCATRAQVACIMQRFISTVKGSGTLQK